jgi:hypothetical protein
MLPLVLAAPVIGAALGAFNGVIVARVRIPSLVVTLATMAAYRGLAQALIGDQSVPLPDAYRGFDDILLAGTLPMPVVVFIIAAIVLGLVLHRTLFGAYVLSLGTNAQASRYSGLPVARVTAGVFVLSGLAAGIGSMMMCSRFAYARWDHAQGWSSTSLPPSCWAERASSAGARRSSARSSRCCSSACSKARWVGERGWRIPGDRERRAADLRGYRIEPRGLHSGPPDVTDQGKNTS